MVLICLIHFQQVPFFLSIIIHPNSLINVVVCSKKCFSLPKVSIKVGFNSLTKFYVYVYVYALIAMFELLIKEKVIF